LAESGVAASSASAAAGINGGGTTSQPFSFISSTILPGFLTAANSQSPIVMDRVFFDYGYFDQFQVTKTTGTIVLGTTSTTLNATSSQIAGFNLNTFNVGIEKSLFGGLASVYVDAPILYADDNVTDQKINGFGDLNLGFKLSLYFDRCTGNALSAGLSVAVPTGHAAQYTDAVVWESSSTGAPIQFFTTPVNPTYIQPWVAGLWNCDRFFVQEYFAVIQPLPDEVATSINNCLSAGYRLWSVDRCCEPNHWITSITPIFGTQTLVGLQHSYNDTTLTEEYIPTDVRFRLSVPTQLFLTEGCQIGVGSRASVFAGVVEPVVGTKAYTIGGTVGLNFYF